MISRLADQGKIIWDLPIKVRNYFLQNNLVLMVARLADQGKINMDLPIKVRKLRYLIPYIN